VAAAGRRPVADADAPRRRAHSLAPNPQKNNNSAPLRTVTACPVPARRRLLAAPVAAKKGGGGKSKGGKGGGKGGDDSDDDDAPPPARSAKGGGGKGGAAASGGGGTPDDLDRLAAATKKDAEERMGKAIATMAAGFETMRTGRANPALLDRVVVDYFGAPTPLKTLAAIAVADAATLVVTPFDRAAFKDVEKALMAGSGDFGATPNSDGERLRINLPPMTQDRRKELAKQAAKAGEECKVAVRNVRKDAMKKLEKGDFGKDAKKQVEDEVQKLTDGYVKKTDDAVKAKSEELLKL